MSVHVSVPSLILSIDSFPREVEPPIRARTVLGYVSQGGRLFFKYQDPCDSVFLLPELQMLFGKMCLVNK